MRSSLAVCAVMACSTFIATPRAVHAQACPPSKTCYYVPPLLPPGPNDEALSYTGELMLAAPTLTTFATVLFGGTATLNYPVPVGGLVGVNIPMNLGDATSFNSEALLGTQVIASSTDLIVEQRLTSYFFHSSANIRPHTAQLGQRFRVAGFSLNYTQNFQQNNDDNNGWDFVSVYAPQDANVTFTAPPSATLPFWNSTNDANITVNLPAGGTYIVRTLSASEAAASNQQGVEIDGALVEADAPVAILAGGRGYDQGINGEDDGSDNVLPVNYWGTQFVVTEYPAPIDQDVRVVADTDGTTVSVNGTLMATLNSGDTYKFTTSGVSYIESSAPVGVFQNAGYQDDLNGFSQVPPIAFADIPRIRLTFQLLPEEPGVGAVILPTAKQNFLVLDGNSVDVSNATPVPGHPEWTVVNLNNLTADTHVLDANSDVQLALATSDEITYTGIFVYLSPYRRPGCGNGVIDGTEQCDDGNAADGDGCSSMCNIEAGWGCDATNPSVPTPCHCASDGVCGNGNYCASGTPNTCATALPNGSAIPAGHGTCGASGGSIDLPYTACASGQCNSTTNQCAGAPGENCATGADCSSVCFNGHCAYPAGQGPCTTADANSTCRSGVCSSTNVCAFPAGQGPCDNSNAATVCVSGDCGSQSNLCTNGSGTCGGDADCPGQYCDASTFACTNLLDVEAPLPLDGVHGMCNNTNNTACTTGRCNATVNTCADVNGANCNINGDCIYNNCSSSQQTCGFEASEGPCLDDTVCADQFACNHVSGTCGEIMLSNATCNQDSDCANNLCDPNAQLCGYLPGDGPCTAGNANDLCETHVCGTASGLCIPDGGCARDVDCAQQPNQFCMYSNAGPDFFLLTSHGGSLPNGVAWANLYCTALLANGQAIPRDHMPMDDGSTRDGSCNTLNANSTCQSHACNASTDTCAGPMFTACTDANQCIGNLCGGNQQCGGYNGADMCTQAGDCQSGICGTNGVCGTVNNQACNANDVCQALVCAQDGNCGLPLGAACNQNSTCRSSACDGTGHICVAAAAGCAVDTECTNTYCDGTSLACVTLLGAGANLPNDGLHTGTCNPSLAQAVCSTGLCNSTSNTCAAANGNICVSASACASNACAGDGNCGFLPGDNNPCNGTDQCRSGTCDASTHRCVAPLNGGGSTPGGSTTGGSTTTTGGSTTGSTSGSTTGGGPNVGGGGGSGAACTDDSACTHGFYCNGTTCTAALADGTAIPTDSLHNGTCTVAVGAAVCASGACNPNTNACALDNGQSCTDADQCASNSCSSNGVCGLPAGAALDANSGGCTAATAAAMCSTKACNPVTQTCAALSANSCTSASQCTSNLCINGLCGQVGNGDCTTDAQCQTGTCVQNHCVEPQGAQAVGHGLFSCSATPTPASNTDRSAAYAISILSALWLLRRSARQRARRDSRRASEAARATHACLASLLIACTLLPLSSAQAADGLRLSRFNPADPTSRWLIADSLVPAGADTGALGYAAGLSSLALRLDFDWAHDPFIVRFPGGNVISHIVLNQAALNIGIGMHVLRELQVSVLLPVQVYGGGTSATDHVEFFNAPDPSAAFGDLRINAVYRFDTPLADILHVGIGGRLWVPSGRETSYNGNGSVAGAIDATVAGEAALFVWSASIGVNLRNQLIYASSPLGPALEGIAAVGVQTPGREFLVGLEVPLSTVLTTPDRFTGSASAVDPTIAAHWQPIPQLTARVGVGAGLTPAIGEPQWRVHAGVEVVPFAAPQAPQPPAAAAPPPPPPHPVEVAAAPPPPQPAEPAPVAVPDQDNDGIPDNQDKCPADPEDKDNFQDDDGCPDPDNDQDSVLDVSDKCPTQAGLTSNDGCPLPDRDNDGIPDAQDNCPDVAGTAANQGCDKPQTVKIDGDHITLAGKINFETGRDVLTKDSLGLLNDLAAVLAAHPELVKITVEGHTDNQGKPEKNLDLSRRRAASVVKYLVGQKVDEQRLASEGFGDTKPVEDNSTSAGRSANRRVEFRVAR